MWLSEDCGGAPHVCDALVANRAKRVDSASRVRPALRRVRQTLFLPHPTTAHFSLHGCDDPSDMADIDVDAVERTTRQIIKQAGRDGTLDSE